MSKRKKFGISKQLSESLSQTVQVARQNAGALRYEIVPLNRIELDPDNPRQLHLQKIDIVTGLNKSDTQ